jgi:hypothetical protein
MAPRVETRILDGLEVTIQQLPPMRWLSMAAKLGRTIAPSLLHLENLSMQSDLGELGPALSAFFTELDPEKLQGYTRDLLASGTVKLDGNICQLNSDDAINLAFSGKPGALLQSLKFALDVNDFFGAAFSAFGLAKPAATALTSTPT